MSQLDFIWRRHAEDGSSEPEPSAADLRLIAPIGESTWLGLDPHGRPVTARRLDEPSDPAAGDAAGEPADVIRRGAELAAVRAPSLVRTLGVQRTKAALWVVSELDDGIRLDRLLALTRPRPAQAAVLGLGVLSGLRAVHAAGYAHGALTAGEVRVGADGQARLDGWAAGTLRRSGSGVRSGSPGRSGARRGSRSLRSLEHWQRLDIEAAGALLADLARAARRSPAAEQSAPALLAAIDVAAGCATHSGADAELVAAPLEAVCGPDDDTAARSELAEVVRAVTASGAAGSATGAAAGAAASSPGVAEGRPAGARTRLHGLWRPIRTWVVALIVLVGVVTLEFVLLHEQIALDVRQLRDAADRPAQAATPLPVVLPPIPRPAPAAAGGIRGVDLRALQSCTPDSVCAVRVMVELSPHQAVRRSAPRAVGWSFEVVDRCTGSTHSAPGGVVSAAPGAARIQAVSRVALPAGRALAVFAMASEPVTGAAGELPKAASEALPVPARSGAC